MQSSIGKLKQQVCFQKGWSLCSYDFDTMYVLRACLLGGGGPQVGEVTCLGGIKK